MERDVFLRGAESMGGGEGEGASLSPSAQPLMGAGDPVEWVTVAGLIFWGGDAT